MRKKACLFSSFGCYGHLNKDSIFLLEPSSTAVGKEKLPSALKYGPLQVVTHATKTMINLNQVHMEQMPEKELASTQIF